MKKVWVVWFEIPYEGGCTPAFAFSTKEEAEMKCLTLETDGYGRWRFAEIEMEERKSSSNS